MNTKIELGKKLFYSSPEIHKIVLDNAISLSLDSTPPVGPEEISMSAPSYFSNNPFNTNIG
jgi:uncharacterized protein YfaP (DUF2135 family)